MKLKLRSLSILLVIFLTQQSNASKLSKAVEALEIYDYFKAKKLFYKAYKKDKAAAALGLSIIYGRVDNPFSHLDSARKYILTADSLFQKLEPKTIVKYRSLNLNDSLAQVWKDSVALRAFKKVMKRQKIEELDQFINEYYFSKYKQQVIVSRDSIEYEKVLNKNTSSEFKSFLEKYPKSHLRIEARNKFNELLFLEIKDTSNYGESYRQFISLHPNNPYVGQAQDSIYFKYIKKKTISSFDRFIKENPNNRNVSVAWRSLYKLYTASNTPSSIIDFRIDFPDYPFKDELSQDYLRNSQEFFPYNNGALWGFKNKEGEVMIKAQYEYVSAFSEGVALVIRNEKVGYINKSNDVVIPFHYEDGEDFKSGVVIVYKDDYVGMRDKLDQELLPTEYDYIGIPSDKMVLASKNGKYGYFDLKGDPQIDFSFKKAYDFKDGIAVVQTDSLYGAINILGDTIIPFKYTFLESFNHLGLARAKFGSDYGVIDKNGSKVLEFEYDAISELNQEVFVVVKKDKYGFAKSNGSLLSALKYDYEPGILSSSEFKSGYVKVWQKGKVGVVDTLGSKIMPAIFQDVDEYSATDLIAVKKRGLWGYSNQSLKLEIPYDYDEAYSFKNGFGLVKSDTSWFKIDEKGKKENLFISSVSKKDSFYIVRYKDLIGIMNFNFEMQTSIKYDSYRLYNKNWVQLIAGSEVDYYHIESNEFLKIE